MHPLEIGHSPRVMLVGFEARRRQLVPAERSKIDVESRGDQTSDALPQFADGGAWWLRCQPREPDVVEQVAFIDGRNPDVINQRVGSLINRSPHDYPSVYGPREGEQVGPVGQIESTTHRVVQGVERCSRIDNVHDPAAEQAVSDVISRKTSQVANGWVCCAVVERSDEYPIIRQAGMGTKPGGERTEQ